MIITGHLILWPGKFLKTGEKDHSWLNKDGKMKMAPDKVHTFITFGEQQVWQLICEGVKGRDFQNQRQDRALWMKTRREKGGWSYKGDRRGVGGIKKFNSSPGKGMVMFWRAFEMAVGAQDRWLLCKVQHEVQRGGVWHLADVTHSRNPTLHSRNPALHSRNPALPQQATLFQTPCEVWNAKSVRDLCAEFRYVSYSFIFV